MPDVAKQIQRDRELETMRARQAVHSRHPALLPKFHAYPPNVDALVNTNEIRFLRKKYIDPITGKDDWKPILFGQEKGRRWASSGSPLPEQAPRAVP